MKVLGITITIIGIVGTLYFGLQAMNQSESISAFGVDIAVSSANWTPVIVSAVVLLIGIIITSRSKKRA